MGSEATSLLDFAEGQPPTAVIVPGSTEGDIPTVREILPPERHLAGIAVGRQVESVLDLETDTHEYPTPTIHSESLLQRVRIEMQKRQANRRMLSRHVERPL